MNLVDEFLLLNRSKKVKIHCVGDSLIDEYYQVKVTRISPEHPVPVMSCQNNFTCKPGGSANTAYQFKHFNADVNLICFPDQKAIKVFQDHKINCLCFDFENCDKCFLPVKRRYLDNCVQVAPRHDFERHLCGLTSEQIESYITFALHNISKLSCPDIAILSDYDKGFFYSPSLIINHYKSMGVKTIVDPKKGPLDKWKGCDIFKPNFKEAEELTGYKDCESQAKFIQDVLECEVVVITMGGERVHGRWKCDSFDYIPSRKVLVESVIGAGDNFAAFFSLAIAHGFNPIEASEIAWNSGSIYVQQRMNRPIIPAELSLNKIVHPEDLRSRDFNLVFTNGCFDILHCGHLETLKFAKSKGDKLVVALNSDQSIKNLKGEKRPVFNLENRMKMMAAFDCVDFVVSFDEDTPIDIINKVMPDSIVKGGDYIIENVVGSDIIPNIYLSPILDGLSTTSAIDKIQLN